MFRVLFICCCWENSLYHHSEIMTCVIAFVKCTAFMALCDVVKLVTIAWTAFVYLVVHSSPFSGVAGTKIGCVGLWVCMYDPWVVWPFYFFLVSLFLFFFFSEVVISNLEVQDFQLGHVSIQKLCCLSKVYPECLTSLALESVWASHESSLSLEVFCNSWFLPGQK